MKSILDTDFIYISGYLLATTTIEDLNPYVVFIGGIIAIIIGILKIIDYIRRWKKGN